MDPDTSFDEMPVVGLALGGGVVRGLAHIGVLGVLERASIHPRVVCGTSVGAVVGAAYASGMPVAKMAEIAEALRWRQLVRPSVSRAGVLDTSRFDDFLDTIIPARDFHTLRFGYAAVARDLVSGERVVLTKGEPARAARASAAIPGLFPPVEIDGRQLVDGTSVEAVPVRTARELGAEYVIGVDVRKASLHVRVTRMLPKRARSSPRDGRPDAQSDHGIVPVLDSYSVWNFASARDLIAAGEAAASNARIPIDRDLRRGAT